MVFAAELSRLTRSLSDAAVDRHRSILDSLSLPTTYPAGRWKTLLATMKRDKKARGDLLRFIVLDDIGADADRALPYQALRADRQLPRSPASTSEDLRPATGGRSESGVDVATRPRRLDASRRRARRYG